MVKIMTKTVKLLTKASRTKVRISHVAGLGIAVIVGAAGSAVVFASVPDGSGVIHGCYKNNTGVLSVIDSTTQTCASNETAITWNQQGQAGQGVLAYARYDNHNVIDCTPDGVNCTVTQAHSLDQSRSVGITNSSFTTGFSINGSAYTVFCFTIAATPKNISTTWANINDGMRGSAVIGTPEFDQASAACPSGTNALVYHYGNPSDAFYVTFE